MAKPRPRNLTRPQYSRPQYSAVPIRPGQFAIISAGLFLTRCMGWAVDELWYDEIVTLTDFVLGPDTFFRVFRVYPVANNHMLFSALSWLWVRFLNFNLSEHLLRVPSLAFSVALLAVIHFWWEKWLGRRLACIAGILFAASPVFTAFGYQFRGYALTLLLAGIAVHALMEIVNGDRRRGLYLHAVSALLLPLVIPTNILLVAAHALFAGSASKRISAGKRWLIGIMTFLPGALGASYYLTLWPQFRRVMGQTAGWDSRLAVTGHLALAFLAHLGPFLLAMVWLTIRPAGKTAGNTGDGGRSAREEALLLLAWCAAVGALLMVASGRAPYPRVFLVFFPTVSLCVLRSVRSVSFWWRRGILVLGGLLVIHGFAWDRVARELTRRQLLAGEHPQNLLQQYYRGRMELMRLAGGMTRLKGVSQAMVMTDAFDFPTFRFYWLRNGLPQGAVITDRNDMLARWRSARKQTPAALWVVARDEIQAAELFRTAGATGRFDVLLDAGPKKLYGRAH